jgi:ABC-type nickel/cobalt efflux system permease component RcnA
MARPGFASGIVLAIGLALVVTGIVLLAVKGRQVAACEARGGWFCEVAGAEYAPWGYAFLAVGVLTSIGSGFALAHAMGRRSADGIALNGPNH